MAGTVELWSVLTDVLSVRAFLVYFVVQPLGRPRRCGILDYILTTSPVQTMGVAQLANAVSGEEATAALKVVALACNVVILTSSLDNEIMIQAILAGVLSYLLNTSTPEQVVETVKSAAKKVSLDWILRPTNV